MEIRGTVVPGKKIGRTLGFPTANILPDDPMPNLPQNGVYAGRIVFETGKTCTCVLNQGKHPTLPDGPSTIEAHILGFAGDLYGTKVTLVYEKFLRPEKAFNDVFALRRQIAQDIAAAKAFFAQS